MGDYDPNEQTVDQVNEHLATIDTSTPEGEAEVQRILQAERDGKARVGVLEGPHNPAPGTSTPEETEAEADAANGRTDTKGATFQEAAEAAEPDETGYVGTSPEAERVGRRDKGLSQRNPAVMNQGGQVPDATPSVDDSEAIESLKSLGN